MTVKFQETKQKKLKRILMLRIMNTLGMIAWREDSFGEAQQKIRMIHPLAWVWLVIMVLYGILYMGIPQTFRELRGIFKEEVVWL